MDQVKVRASNIELLRNISMFMILVIHANFVALPHIQYEELSNNTAPSIIRFFIEAMGVVAVDIFVFISGWFGIQTRSKSVLSLVYQIFFLVGGGGILLILLGEVSFSAGWLLDVFQLSRRDWFIKSYLVLMIIAPILNTYCKTAEEKTQRFVIIAFFLFETVFGWVMGGRRFFVDGYGPLHFIGLYIFAQYIHNTLDSETTPSMIKRAFSLPAFADLCVFLLTVLVNTFVMVIGSLYIHDANYLFSAVYAYNNPLVVLGAVYLFLFFKKLNVPYVKLINWLGASSFSVYLIHTQITVFNNYFSPQVQYIYNHYSGIVCLGIEFLFLSVIYLVSVLIDQLRLQSWNKIWSWTHKDA